MPPINVCIVGTSHVRRLRDAINASADPAFSKNFGLSDVHVSFVCGGGWTLSNIEHALPLIREQHPQYIILKVGSNDLCSANLQESISVADGIVETAKHLRHSCHTKGVLVCSVTYRGQGRYLPTAHAVETYNEKVHLANKFLKAVIEDEPGLEYWRHKGMSESIASLLSADGVHVNPAGQFKLYKSIRGAILYACRQCQPQSDSRSKLHHFAH